MILDLIFPKSCLLCKKANCYICNSCFEKMSIVKQSGENYSLFNYEGVIRLAITSLKYKFAADLANELVERCISKLNRNIFDSKNITLIPIPLSKKRQNWRGFNQSELIGKLIALKMGWSFANDLLFRVKHSIPQVGLSGQERINNLHDSFVVNNNSKVLKSALIILFDDVYTTGTTMNEALKTLEKHGYNNVKTLTLARQNLQKKYK